MYVDFPKFSFLFPKGKMVWKRIRNPNLEKEKENFGKESIPMCCIPGTVFCWTSLIHSLI
jgi:hypothetical protein